MRYNIHNIKTNNKNKQTHIHTYQHYIPYMLGVNPASSFGGTPPYDDARNLEHDTDANMHASRLGESCGRATKSSISGLSD